MPEGCDTDGAQLPTTGCGLRVKGCDTSPTLFAAHSNCTVAFGKSRTRNTRSG